MFDHSISGMYSCTWIFSVYKMKFLLKKMLSKVEYCLWSSCSVSLKYNIVLRVVVALFYLLVE